MTQHSLFDRALKVLARNHADAFLRLAFPHRPVRLLGTVENVEIDLPAQRVDFVHQIEDEGTEKLLHLEFQTRHEPDLPRRLFVYSGALTRRFDQEVLTLVLYLERRHRVPPGVYETRLGGEVVNRFRYPTVGLWEHEERIRSGELRALAPLLVVVAEERDEGVLAEERRLILEERDERRRAELLAAAVTVASRYFERDFLWDFFREEVEMMREASFIEEWIEEGIRKGEERGIQRGLQKGLLQARREDIMDLLLIRLDLSYRQIKTLEDHLKRIEDPEALREAVGMAAQAESLEAFLEQLEALEKRTAIEEKTR